MTNTPETMALAPCPFCGGEAVDVDTSEICCPIEYNAHARCSDCDAQGPAEYRWDTPNEAKAEAIAAWNRRADTRPAPVSVKPLEWEDVGYGWAKTSWGGYTITDRFDPFWDEAFGWEHSSRGDGDRSEEVFESVDAAKAAAQADYEARILPAIQPDPSVEGLIEALRDIRENIYARMGGPEDGPADEWEWYQEGLAEASRSIRAALAAYEGEKRDG
jgi:Lar family restriction alleviation protein